MRVAKVQTYMVTPKRSEIEGLAMITLDGDIILMYDEEMMVIGEIDIITENAQSKTIV